MNGFIFYKKKLKSVEYGTILVVENFQRGVGRDMLIELNGSIVFNYFLPKYSILRNFRIDHCLHFENIFEFNYFKRLIYFV